LRSGAGLGVPEMMRSSAKQAILSHDFREQHEQREGGEALARRRAAPVAHACCLECHAFG
jgi:hypothetical protein